MKHKVLVVLILCLPGGLLFTTRANQSSIPAPPSSRADRFGVYNWNIDDGVFPGGGLDRLNWGANLVAKTGSRTIRLFLGKRDIYRVYPSAAGGSPSLVEMASNPAYDQLFRDPRFMTYMLTVYVGEGSSWTDGLTQQEYDAERDEIRDFGEYLLGKSSLAGKTFILLNWEGDNAIAPLANKATAWDSYREWIRSRSEGVKWARDLHPESPVHLYSGLEFNAVHRNGVVCGTPVSDPAHEDPLRNRCVMDFVAPEVDVDYYSYSSWGSIAVTADDPDPVATVRDQLRSDLALALARIKERRPEVTEANFIVGEFGRARMQYGECNAGNYLSSLFDALEGPGAFNASYAIYWQIADDNRNFGLGIRFGGLGFFKPVNGMLRQTLVGSAFQRRLAGQPSVSDSPCPLIRQKPPESGILDNMTGEARFHLDPDSILSIYAQGCCMSTTTPFSGSGNLVHFDQWQRQFLMPRDNSSFYYESPVQINASLPGARLPGEALVYVTTSMEEGGIDSNGQIISLDCSACPAIQRTHGVIDATYGTGEYRPGQTVSIRGAFSSMGNAVVLERRDANSAIRSYRLQPVAETASRIDVKLPAELLLDEDASLRVVDADGRPSNEYTIITASEGSPGGPQLRLDKNVLNLNGIAPNAIEVEFHRGTRASIFGRFSPSGNSLVIEQYDAQAALHRRILKAGSPDWSESATRVDISLPPDLFEGRALLYVIDAQRRESDASGILITPTSVACVSAASFAAGGLARESIVAAFGNALGTTTVAAGSLELPDLLGGSQITVKGQAGRSRNAPLLFVSPSQINFQVPPDTSTGTATLTITSGDGSLTFSTIEVVDVAPGLFAADANGRGVAAAAVVRVKPDGSQKYEPVSTFDAETRQSVALPIDFGPETDQVYLALFGTGLRFRSGLGAVNLMIGNTAATVTYAGSQNYYVGLDQVNVLLPRTLAGSGAAPIALTVDGKRANAVMVSFR
jgi:uncharacterized protein (TIGR03437 family)